MNLCFFTEARFVKCKGTIYAAAGFSMFLWERYLPYFEKIKVVARVNESEDVPSSFLAVVSDRVIFIELPYYVGGWGFLKERSKIRNHINSLLCPNYAFLCRVPGTIGSEAVKCMKKRGIKYGLEVVGDPWESLSWDALHNVFSPILQIRGSNSLKRLAKGASAALYVTDHILQQKYPVKNGVFSVSASNVILKNSHFALSPKIYDSKISKRTVRLLAVGTLAQLYKAPDIVLKAVARLHNDGYDVFLTWFGSGRMIEPMKRLAESLGIANKVNFAGSVSQERIREEFLITDIFVHASRAEGLPRALIEAMAYGLPCIGSIVAGIPELLSHESLVPKNNVKALSNKISFFINNPSFMNKESSRNLAEAIKYNNDILTERRNSFYSELIKVSSL